MKSWLTLHRRLMLLTASRCSMKISAVFTTQNRSFYACPNLIRQPATTNVDKPRSFPLKLQPMGLLLLPLFRLLLYITTIPTILRPKTVQLTRMNFSLLFTCSVVMKMESHINRQTRLAPIADHGILFHAYSSSGRCNISNSYVKDIEEMAVLYKSMSPSVCSSFFLSFFLFPSTLRSPLIQCNPF